MKKAPKLGLFVRMEGLEPTRLAALDPKSSMSTNFTTSAILKNYIKTLFDILSTFTIKSECKFK